MNREKRIIRASWWAIIGNSVLAVLKLSIGFFSGSYAVVADGIDSASDMAASVVVLVAARIMARPPNLRFAYGYQKADSIATKLLSFIIFFAGAQLAWSTVQMLIRGNEIRLPSLLAIWVSVFSIAGKLVLTLLLEQTGKSVDSLMLRANAKNMRNDVLISLGVLISLVLTIWLNAPLFDRLIALMISIFIMYSAFRIFLKSNIDLMDGIDDPRLYKALFDAVKRVRGAENPHRVRARKIGHCYMINLDIEVDASLSVREAHDISKAVEQSIKENLKNVYDIMVHLEPLGNKEDDEKFGISESVIRSKTENKQ